METPQRTSAWVEVAKALFLALRITVEGALLVSVIVMGFAYPQMQHKDPQAAGGMLAVIILFLALIGIGETIGFLLRWNRKRNQNQNQASAAAQEVHSGQLEAYAKQALQPISVPGFAPKVDEVPYFACPVQAYQLRASARRAGAYTGVSVPVPGLHGLRLNTGLTHSNSVAGHEPHLVANGTVIVTNHRIVIQSNIANMAWRLDEISTFRPFSDGLQIATDHSVPTTLISGSQYLWITVVKVAPRLAPAPSAAPITS